MPEHLLHGNAPWRPRDRDRRLLALRYNVQHMVVGNYLRHQPVTPDAPAYPLLSRGVAVVVRVWSMGSRMRLSRGCSPRPKSSRPSTNPLD